MPETKSAVGHIHWLLCFLTNFQKVKINKLSTERESMMCVCVLDTEG